jgi:hypothetical protein
MAKHHQTDCTAAIDDLRRLAREPFEVPRELLRLRNRITMERERSHRRILETIARQANVDLQPIYDDARRRNAAKRRYVTETLTRLQAQAYERSTAQKEHFHQIRADYLKTFGKHLAAQIDQTVLKFQDVIDKTSEARPGTCNVILGSSCSDPDPGTYEASAEMQVSPDTPGMWLFPRIFIDTGDCDDTSPGRTFHDLTYRMGPPANSFAVTDVSVDLISNGVATFVAGDGGFLTELNTEYEHTFVQLDVLVSQLVNGVWQQWPVVSDRLFSGKGEYDRQVRAILYGQTYPVNLLIRKAEVGGGDLLCFVHVACKTEGAGTDGRTLLDCGHVNAQGIFLGGVELIGSFV